MVSLAKCNFVFYTFSGEHLMSNNHLPPKPCVYMLRCRDGSLYTGWTNDFAGRLKAHQAGKASKYTRSRLPVEAAYLEFVEDKSAALKREAAIKKKSPVDKQALIVSDSNVLDRRDVD